MNFYKYQGTGNDFVMIDNRKNVFDKSNLRLIHELCDRKFGIGADGLILIENIDGLDFNMIYFNADGSQSFCGNGSRCAVSFASYLGIIGTKAQFLAIDGEHEAWINEKGEVSLKMHDVEDIEKGNDYYFINTGSPHYIIEVRDVDEMNVCEIGRKVRNSNRFKDEGTNVNFVHYRPNGLDIRTYERGVEDETLSCGTGVTAAALSWADATKSIAGKVTVNTKGGTLQVAYKRTDLGGFNDIWLIGPAVQVFKGQLSPLERG